MFALRSVDLTRPILGCADGPAAFNADLTARGGRVLSADPLYAFTATEIRSRIADARDRIVENTKRNLGAYRWDVIPSIEAMQELRLGAMERFLGDYDAGRSEGRYVSASLPRLPFADGAFALALCSHFLFLYSSTLDAEFHIAAIRELTRVAGEARVYPLLDFDGRPSPHLPAVIRGLTEVNLRVELVPVPYEFLRGATQMLRIRNS